MSLFSPSYDSKVSIYTLTYWFTQLTMLGCLHEHDLAITSQHYHAKRFTLMLIMFPKFFVQCDFVLDVYYSINNKIRFP